MFSPLPLVVLSAACLHCVVYCPLLSCHPLPDHPSHTLPGFNCCIPHPLTWHHLLQRITCWLLRARPPTLPPPLPDIIFTTAALPLYTNAAVKCHRPPLLLTAPIILFIDVFIVDQRGWIDVIVSAPPLLPGGGLDGRYAEPVWRRIRL